VEPDFEWDASKDAKNQLKHGVSFGEAQLASLDPQRVIARDVKHSKTEKRFCCFRQVELGVLTVRFTYRGAKIRIIGAGFWTRGRKIYETHRQIQE
jgi:hypothetical protein